ncbi:hypothetical protein GCM10023082_59060 [Streptomyces tremellae]|uniref:Uncharacterized protein n=1 Tax=Streptomyces tremellae TaxID=1124239 RepID=A0ABP7G5E9_9ACTN
MYGHGSRARAGAAGSRAAARRCVPLRAAADGAPAGVQGREGEAVRGVPAADARPGHAAADPDGPPCCHRGRRTDGARGGCVTGRPLI